MGEELYAICMEKLDDNGKKAVESLWRCYSEQMEWHKELVEHLVKLLERRESE